MTARLPPPNRRLADHVVIAGARAPVALDMARSFVAAGARVTLADSVTGWAARMANVPVEHRRLPPPRQHFTEFARDITALAADGAMIVPTCEEVFYLAAALGDGPHAARLFAPPLSVLRQLHSKLDFIDLCTRIGIAAPATHALTRADDVRQIDGAQLVIKPEFSRFGAATLLRPSRAKLDALSFAGGQRYAAQQFVAGEEICLWAAARDGAIVASATYRPRWRHGHSASYAFEIIECPAAEEIAAAIAAHFGMTGQISLDLIRTADGQLLPIECNPRATSGLHAFAGSADLARALMGTGASQRITSGLFHLAPAMLTLGIASALRAGRLADWRRDWRHGRDVLSRAGARGPAIGAMIDAARFALAGLRSGTSASSATTQDIEWNGEAMT